MISFFVLSLIAGLTSFGTLGSQSLLVNILVKQIESGVFVNIFLIVIGIVGLQAIPTFISILDDYNNKMVWFLFERKTKISLLEKLSQLDIAEHENPSTKDLIQRVSENGTWRIIGSVDRQFWILRDFISMLFAVGILAINYPHIFIIVIIATIPELIVETRYARDVWGVYAAKGEVRRRVFDIEEHFQRLGSLVELKIYNNAKLMVSIVRDLVDNFIGDEKKHENKRAIFRLFAVIFSQIGLGITLFFVINDIFNKNLEIGTGIFIIGSISIFRISLSGLFGSLSRQYQDNLFVNDFFALMDIPNKIIQAENPIKLDGKKPPSIEFKNVSFSYPGSPVSALNNISFKIEPGEKIAIVGINGAGKTTLTKLICRFYDPTDGQILIDGNDLKNIDIGSWYSILGALFQDYAKYNFKVEEAIAQGDTEATLSLDRVKKSAQNSDAHIFIEEWQKQYQQQLGVQFAEGVEPSVGQWQKLALARAYYKDPQVYILDEPTASIDAEAEMKIFERMESNTAGKTVILISHRFSTVRRADRIIVIKDHQLIEQGSHEELLKESGEYAKLFKLQQKGYE